MFLRALSSIAAVVVDFFFFWTTCDIESSIPVSELSAGSAVAVVNAYGSFIGDDEDHVDDKHDGYIYTLCADQLATSTSLLPPSQANPGHLTIREL